MPCAHQRWQYIPAAKVRYVNGLPSSIAVLHKLDSRALIAKLSLNNLVSFIPTWICTSSLKHFITSLFWPSSISVFFWSESQTWRNGNVGNCQTGNERVGMVAVQVTEDEFQYLRWTFEGNECGETDKRAEWVLESVGGDLWGKSRGEDSLHDNLHNCRALFYDWWLQ